MATMSSLELKIPPPVVALIFAVLMWVISLITPAFQIATPLRLVIFAGLAVLGGSLAISGFRAFGNAQTTVDPSTPERATALVTTGIYQITRNPMYLGMTIVLLGWAVFLASLAALIGPVLYALFLTRFQIVPEERALTGIFGAAYEGYRSRVRRWL